MDHLMITMLVIKCCLCYGCKDKFKKLKKDIPQIHVEFDTEQGMATISGAVDPAIVRKKLKKNGITHKILQEKSLPINNHHHHQQKQIVSPKPSVTEIHKQVPGVTPNVTDCHLNHEHELVEVKSYKRFACDGCKEDGFNSRYRCEPCDFDLHEECKSPKLTISPEIGEELDFEFCDHPPNERLCDACGKGIHGYFYKCKAEGNGMDLQPCCAKLKAQVHIHYSDMVMDLRKKVSSKCLWCRKKQPPGTYPECPGWCYVSQCKKYNIHVHCITQMLHKAWQRGRVHRTGQISIESTDFQLMAVSERNRDGGGTEASIIISIFKIIVGILLGIHPRSSCL